MTAVPPSILTCEPAWIVPQDADVPLVVKYLPDWLACAGITYTLEVSRATVTAPEAPPPVKPVPAVTDSMSPLVAITDQAEPVHTYIAASTELK